MGSLLFKISIIALLASVTSSCGSKYKSKISVKTVGGANKPKEVSDRLQLAKTQFQTRELITINLVKDSVKFGDVYSIINETTQKTLIDKQSVGVELAGDDDGTLKLTDEFEIQVRFYPQSQENYEDFSYGENSLKLVIDSSSSTVFQMSKLKLTDFDMMGLATVGFTSNDQVVSGFQGWVNQSTTAAGNPYSRSAASQLTAGYFNVINPSDN